MADPESVVIGGPTAANPHNSDRWNRRMQSLYAGTRLERQELNGELLTDNPGALWTEELLERCRDLPPHAQHGEGDQALPGGGVNGSEAEGSSKNLGLGANYPSTTFGGPPPHLAMGRQEASFLRLVIAVDPPTGDGTCGIIATAKDTSGKAHLHPNAPLLVVAESNQGGLMVQSVLRISNPDLRIKLVPAIQGKTDRAAPVAMLFEAGRVVVHGRFPALEAQLCGMIAGGDYEGPGVSPDRAAAMVWGLTELMLTPERAPPRIRTLYRRA